jgi:hypothetical protein
MSPWVTIRTPIMDGLSRFRQRVHEHARHVEAVWSVISRKQVGLVTFTSVR